MATMPLILLRSGRLPTRHVQTLGWHNSDCDPNDVAVWSGGAGSSDWSNNANWT